MGRDYRSRCRYGDRHRRPADVLHLYESDKGVKETHRRFRFLHPPPGSRILDRDYRYLLQVPQWLEFEHRSDINNSVAGDVTLRFAYISVNTLSEDILMGIHVYWPHDRLQQLSFTVSVR